MKRSDDLHIRMPSYIKLRAFLAKILSSINLICETQAVMKLQRGVFSTLSLLPFWGCVLGGQIPMVNGVIGSHGLGHSETINFKTDSQLDQQVLKSSQKTPGKLRGVIENSGVCGWLVPSLL